MSGRHWWCSGFAVDVDRVLSHNGEPVAFVQPPGRRRAHHRLPAVPRSSDDRILEDLRDVPQDVVFAAFCTYRQVFGHFAMGFGVGIEGRLVDRVGRREFAERFAAHFDTYVLYGDTEPPGLWTVILADGTRLRAAMDEEDDRYVLDAATAPVPGLPEVRVSEDLWQLR